jgi:hypothetical protein
MMQVAQHLGLGVPAVIDLLRTGLAARRADLQRAGRPHLEWMRTDDHDDLERYVAMVDSQVLLVTQTPLPSRTGAQLWSAAVNGCPLPGDGDRPMLFDTAERAMAAVEPIALEIAVDAILNAPGPDDQLAPAGDRRCLLGARRSRRHGTAARSARR